MKGSTGKKKGPGAEEGQVLIFGLDLWAILLEVGIERGAMMVGKGNDKMMPRQL